MRDQPECQAWFSMMAERNRNDLLPGDIVIIGQWLVPHIFFNDPTVQLICIPPVYTREQELEDMLELTADLIKSTIGIPVSLLAHCSAIYDLIDDKNG